MGKTNTSGAYVHVATGGATVPNHAVAPGEDFPDDIDYDTLDPALYADSDDDAVEAEVPGPSQRPGEGVASAPANEEWKGVTVPQLRERLDVSDGRKDDLVAAAVAQGLTPEDFD